MSSSRTTLPAAGEEFTLDALRGDGLERAAAVLRERGLVQLRGLGGRSDVLDTAVLLMSEPWQHRDADPDGLTVIRDTGQHDGRAGFAGLGRGDLELHTECAQLPRPPRLMVLACVRAAEDGGESLVVDGKAVLAELAASRPAALEALSAPRAAYFGGSDGQFAPVLEHLRGGQWRLRLRQDELARFSPEAQAHFPALRRAVEHHTSRMRLACGQALVLDNHRVLHGRTRFTGERLLLRALGWPRPALGMEAGFPSPCSAAGPAVTAFAADRG
ncbi:TauD/TfdA family dioxygenase [Kitasatospora purpeofusca]|uniref:TauD/TfdA family dioxygenase n=1 Tax=Kitasatospora purpeofusca TaxID=67352 RepID=A0ABZ1TU69_9ACTN|nr:TauD/TfdA family dioxygenase [Kitasatospora purpeofusca]